jgi:hypothetical protein
MQFAEQSGLLMLKVINEELSLYRNNYRPKGGKLIHCFYAAPKGEKPQGESASIRSWNMQIDNADDLKGRKVTRTKTLNLNSCTNLTLDNYKGESGTGGK